MEVSHIIVFATGHGQQTNQTETIQHEAYDMRSNAGEDPHQQADGISSWESTSSSRRSRVRFPRWGGYGHDGVHDRKPERDGQEDKREATRLEGD
jgi:hypothetical protein